MPTIRFIEADGTEHVVDASIGQTVMQAAVGNHVPGILGDCGGSCACATCHAYIEPAFAAGIPAPDEAESDMLECAANAQATSRLTCQIRVTPALDGLVIHLANERS